jgi:hypothetical protein
LESSSEIKLQQYGVFGNYDPPQIKLAQNGAGCNGMLPLSGTLLCCTGGIPEELLILPPGAIQSCHLIRSGLDCQIPLSEAAWRLQSEKQAVRCGLSVIRQERCDDPM